MQKFRFIKQPDEYKNSSWFLIPENKTELFIDIVKCEAKKSTDLSKNGHGWDRIFHFTVLGADERWSEFNQYKIKDLMDYIFEIPEFKELIIEKD